MNDDRQLYPDLKLIKREVSERMVIALREIFRSHPAYTYKEDDGESNIIIYPSYADIPGNIKLAITVKAGGYNFDLMSTLWKNVESQIRTLDGRVGHRHADMLSISLTLIVEAYNEEESSDIADELAMLIGFAARDYFSHPDYGLVIRGVQVGETDLSRQEQDIYQTTLSVAVDLPWSGTITEAPANYDEYIIDVEVSDVASDASRAPGIEVFRQRYIKR